jgi:hypothetical protein
MPNGRSLLWMALVAAGVFVGIERYKASKA